MTTLRFVGAVLTAVLLSACAISPTPPKPPATLYSAAKILTMDEQRPTATAVAVAGERIIGVGDVRSLKRKLKNFQLTEDRRFEDKIILPGLIDNHLHPALAGILLPATFITPWDWQLPSQQVQGVQGREAYLARLSAAIAAAPADELFITWGYHQYFHGQLNRSDLDAIAAGRPVIVWQRSFHEIIANSAAMNVLGIDEQEYRNHPNIDIERGHFWELGLFAIFPKLAPVILNPERFNAGVREGFVHALQNGITTVADQGTPLLNLDMELGAINQVIAAEQLPLRVFMVGNGKTLAQQGYAAGVQIMDSLPQRNTTQLTFLPKQVKLLADGAFYSQLMQMQDGYTDGHHGEWIMPPEDLTLAAHAYWQAGYQLHIHVNGDLGVKIVLDLIELMQDTHPRKDHHTVLHHYGYANASQAERIARLGVLVSANPFYLWALADKYAEIGLGPERAAQISRLGDLEKHGVSVSFHSDLPMAPASPLTLAGVAASRITAKGTLLAPEQRMSVDSALRGITIEAARAIQQQDNIGSITPGKLADFTILDQDPTKIEPQDFASIPVWGTVLGGAVHPAPE
ncbi:MAG: amidohydrolase [Gammaproteobacteria bacterium]|nr:amidohydrolase [Gammaproteobacteria bacterium]